MNEDEAKLFLADLLDGIHYAEWTRHDKHQYINRVPISEEEMLNAYMVAQHNR